MKILFVSRFLPHPDVRDSGGQDVYHYIHALSQHHDVSLIAFVTSEQKSASEFMRTICTDVISIPYKPDALLGRLWRLSWRICLPRVYGRVISVRYWRQLQRLLVEKQFDIVIVDGMMAIYGWRLKNKIRIVDEIDIYSIVAYHLYSNQTHPVKRALDWFDWWRTVAAEFVFIHSYDGIWVRSTKDSQYLSAYFPGKPMTVAYPWFEGLEILQEIPIKRPRCNNLLFVGAMSHPKNIEAVIYFAQNVLPLVQQHIPDVTFTIVGSFPASSVQKLANKYQNVIVTGEVDDLRPYYAQAAVNVVPLLTGGGIIVKTLNGLASARPTVSTIFGVSGIDAKPGQDFFLVELNPEQFADAVIQLLSDTTIWYRMAQNGRAFIKKQYNWFANMRQLETFLRELILNHS